MLKLSRSSKNSERAWWPARHSAVLYVCEMCTYRFLVLNIFQILLLSFYTIHKSFQDLNSVITKVSQRFSAALKIISTLDFRIEILQLEKYFLFKTKQNFQCMTWLTFLQNFEFVDQDYYFLSPYFSHEIIYLYCAYPVIDK